MDNLGEGDVDLIKAPIVIDNVSNISWVIVKTFLIFYSIFRAPVSWRQASVVSLSHL